MKRKGFTLIELLVVIIILAILASLAIAQYTKIVEKSRASEARTVLGSLRTAQRAYYLERGSYLATANLSYLGIDAPTTCATTHYFQYTCDTNGTCTATRCTGTQGKQPGVTTAYSLTLAIDGTWGGSAGY